MKYTVTHDEYVEAEAHSRRVMAENLKYGYKTHYMLPNALQNQINSRLAELSLARMLDAEYEFDRPVKCNYDVRVNNLTLDAKLCNSKDKRAIYLNVNKRAGIHSDIYTLMWGGPHSYYCLGWLPATDIRDGKTLNMFKRDKSAECWSHHYTVLNSFESLLQTICQHS